MQECGFTTTRILSYKGRINDTVLIRENTDQSKTVFSHIFLQCIAFRDMFSLFKIMFLRDTIGFLLFNFRGCKINVFNMFWCRSFDQTSFCWVGLKERNRYFSYCKKLCYFSLSFPKYDSSNAFLLLRLPRNSSEFSWLLRKLIFFVYFFLGHHLFSTHTKFHEKLILLTPDTHTYRCVLGVRG